VPVRMESSLGETTINSSTMPQFLLGPKKPQYTLMVSYMNSHYKNYVLDNRAVTYINCSGGPQMHTAATRILK
jgi:hypothetical protein